MRWSLLCVGGAATLAVVAGLVIAAYGRPGQRLVGATSLATSPAAQIASHSSAPGAGPGRQLAARTTAAVNGSVIRRGVKPVTVEVGGKVRLDVTVKPKTGTEVTELYLGIAGPGSWGDERGKPVGHYKVLLHDETRFSSDRHFTVTWNPVPPDRLGPVHLSVFYNVSDNVSPSLIEQIPVSFRVSGRI